jgi:hypothetical protein
MRSGLAYIRVARCGTAEACFVLLRCFPCPVLVSAYVCSNTQRASASAENVRVLAVLWGSECWEFCSGCCWLFNINRS